MHWCTDCGSALAEAEVGVLRQELPSIDVRFKAVDEAAVAAKFDCAEGHTGKGALSAVIWTTTPGPCRPTAPSPCTPISTTPWCRWRASNPERLILAAELVKDVMDSAGIEKFHNLGYAKGAALELLRFNHPFYSFRRACGAG